MNLSKTWLFVLIAGAILAASAVMGIIGMLLNRFFGGKESTDEETE